MLGDADAQCRLLEIAPSSSSDGILQQCLPKVYAHCTRFVHAETKCTCCCRLNAAAEPGMIIDY